MASIWLTESGEGPFYYGMSIEEAKKWAVARKNRYKIKKGERYLNVTQIHEGQIMDFKAIIDIDKLCHKYEIYEPC